MATKLGLRDRAIISFGDYFSGVVPEREIKKRMEEISSADKKNFSRELSKPREEASDQILNHAESMNEKNSITPPRRRRGRPDTMGSEEKMTVRLPRNMYDKIHEMAKTEKTSVSYIVRALLATILKIDDNRNPKTPQKFY